MSSSSKRKNPQLAPSSSRSSGEAAPQRHPSDGPNTPPQPQPHLASPADAAAAAATMMARQQYGATAPGHPVSMGEYPPGMQQQQQHQGFVPPPPTYDTNFMAAAWDQLQQQQQQLSPVIYHTSPPGVGNNNGAGPPQHLSPSLQYPYMYPYPPPTGRNGQVPPPPHQQFYATPPFGYPMQQAVQPPPRQQQQSELKPPRRQNSGRRGGSTPSPSQSNIETAHAISLGSSDLPDMSEIFGGPPSGGGGPNHSYMTPLVDNGKSGSGGSSRSGGGGGYGSISPVAPASPKVYNAPPSSATPRRLPPSGRSSGIPRSDSGNDLQQQGKQKRKGPFSTIKQSIHRRTHSDTLLRGAFNRRMRANSSEVLPPSIPTHHNRSRTLSGGNPFVGKPTHRRTNSTNSMVSNGDASQVSIRSNIVHSSLFAGMDPNTGNVLMHFPYEAIRVVMIPDSNDHKTKKRPFQSKYQSIPMENGSHGYSSQLALGHLYADLPPNIDQFYEDYVKLSDEIEQGDAPPWESLEAPHNPRQAAYKDMLPVENYVMPVRDDIYRRVMSEVAAARGMPCGLFFCGHHEDVSFPSIWIAGILVILLFATLIALSFYTECSTFECLST